MAELLVKINDNPDFTKEQIKDDKVRKIKNRGRYKAGDIVVVKPDGWSWGKEEKRKFLIIRIKGLTEKEAKELVRPYEVEIGKSELGMKMVEMKARRRYKIDLNSLPIKDFEKLRDEKVEYQPFLKKEFTKEIIKDKLWQQK